MARQLFRLLMLISLCMGLSAPGFARSAMPGCAMMAMDSATFAQDTAQSGASAAADQDCPCCKCSMAQCLALASAPSALPAHDAAAPILRHAVQQMIARPARGDRLHGRIPAPEPEPPTAA